MECATVSVDIGDGCCTPLRENIRTAKKQHKCRECREPILPGDKYEDFVGVERGGLYKHKTCADCLSLRDAFFSDGFYFGFIRESLSEHIRECFGEIAESKLYQLTPGAREWVCGEIEEYWQDNEDED